MFFEDIIHDEIGQDEKIETSPRCKEIITRINKEIKENRHILDKIKDTKPLARQIVAELHAGIANIIEIIKTNTHLTNEEKRERIDQFDDYLCKIRYIDAQSFFRKKMKK